MFFVRKSDDGKFNAIFKYNEMTDDEQSSQAAAVHSRLLFTLLMTCRSQCLTVGDPFSPKNISYAVKDHMNFRTNFKAV